MKTKGSRSSKLGSKINFSIVFQYLTIAMVLVTGGCSSLDRHSNHTDPTHGQAQSEATWTGSPKSRDMDGGTWTGMQQPGQAQDPTHGQAQSEATWTGSPKSRYMDTRDMDRHNANTRPMPEELPGQAHEHPGTLSELQPPYPVPVARTPSGFRATPTQRVRRCPAASLRYCDHRTNRCGCVKSSDARNILQRTSPGF